MNRNSFGHQISRMIDKAQGKPLDAPPPNPFTAADERKDFVSRLALMHIEAGRLGLYYTMHKIHEAVKQVGYEIAGTPELYDKMEQARDRAEKKARA